MAAKRVTIDIVSDTICPWCFVGKRRLEKALLDVAPSIEASIRWHPFLLDPTLPKEGTSKMARYESKFGAARIAAMLPHMAKVGADEGIAFDYGGLISATGLSHAYLEAAFAAGGAALQDKVVEAFFRHYFEQKGDIGDSAALHALALGAGVPADAIAPLLDPSKAAVAEAAAMASASTWQRKYRISGVPHFIINGRHSLGGAQEPALLVEAIRAAAEEMV